MDKKQKKSAGGHRERMDRMHTPTLRNWEKPNKPAFRRFKANTSVDMGWGRLILGHTFESNDALFDTMSKEAPAHRDITLYLRDPHVILAMAPDKFFIDPSHTYRLWSYDYRTDKMPPSHFSIRRASSREHIERISELYKSRRMVPLDQAFISNFHPDKERSYFVAETANGELVGTVTGVDHWEIFNDPENGASLWCLAVDPKANAPGVGEALVRHLVEHYFTRGRNYVDLSVMHDNREAIGLYEKLGFQRVPVFCVKYKNPINEPLFIAPKPEQQLNPYAMIIINEARRRGIGVEIVDEHVPLFQLNMGGRTICCHESLTDMTSAIAMMRCDDKRLTCQALKRQGIRVPQQYTAGEKTHHHDILERHKRVVVKPARGEQGKGIRVDLRSTEELDQAVADARRVCPDVLIEAYMQGHDLRMIVIGFKFVAAAVRRPPEITGTGRHRIETLIEKYNRRRMAATGGESQVPMDAETRRCIAAEGFALDDVLPLDRPLILRKTANLHTGGTIHDVTADVHPDLIAAAENTAKALNIPVTGIDLCVPDIKGPDYHVIEANERPGLANHEPQPVVERFIDFLFPETASTPRSAQ